MGIEPRPFASEASILPLRHILKSYDRSATNEFYQFLASVLMS